MTQMPPLLVTLEYCDCLTTIITTTATTTVLLLLLILLFLLMLLIYSRSISIYAYIYIYAIYIYDWCMTMFSLWSAPLGLNNRLWRRGAPTELPPLRFPGSFLLVFHESLACSRCSTMGVCQALCDTACQKSQTNAFDLILLLPLVLISTTTATVLLPLLLHY